MANFIFAFFDLLYKKIALYQQIKCRKNFFVCFEWIFSVPSKQGTCCAGWLLCNWMHRVHEVTKPHYRGTRKQGTRSRCSKAAPQAYRQGSLYRVMAAVLCQMTDYRIQAPLAGSLRSILPWCRKAYLSKCSEIALNNNSSELAERLFFNHSMKTVSSVFDAESAGFEKIQCEFLA